MGIEEIRKGIIGGEPSRILRLGLRCFKVGFDGPGVDGLCAVGGAAESEADAECDAGFEVFDVVRSGTVN